MDTADLYLIYTFITARKQSLRRLCFHVCLSFHGGRAWRGRGQGGMRRRGHAWVVGGVHAKEGGCVAGETATAAGGTHPTGMHSCFI